jgi:hypothetical protein
MQIRDAVGAPGLLEPRWLDPLLDLSVRAFRRAYRTSRRPSGRAVVLRGPGERRAARGPSCARPPAGS